MMMMKSGPILTIYGTQNPHLIFTYQHWLFCKMFKTDNYLNLLNYLNYSATTAPLTQHVSTNGFMTYMFSSLSNVIKLKYVNLYIASSQSASDALPLPISQRLSTNLCKPTLQPGIQRTLRDHGYGLVYNAI